MMNSPCTPTRESFTEKHQNTKLQELAHYYAGQSVAAAHFGYTTNYINLEEDPLKEIPHHISIDYHQHTRLMKAILYRNFDFLERQYPHIINELVLRHLIIISAGEYAQANMHQEYTKNIGELEFSPNILQKISDYDFLLNLLNIPSTTHNLHFHLKHRTGCILLKKRLSKDSFESIKTLFTCKLSWF